MTPANNTTTCSTYGTHIPFNTTMTSPNVAASAKNGTAPAKPAFGTSKVLYIGKDRHPLTIQSLVPVSAPTFMKQSGFHSLVSTLRSHAAAYPSVDLMAAIADELPINTASASNEASIICESIRRAPFDVNNLNPCAFFDDGGSRITTTVPFDPAQRPPNVVFVNFSCTIRCATIDTRIQQPDYSFNFSLKLPQTLQPQIQQTSKQPQQTQQPQHQKKAPQQDANGDGDEDALHGDDNDTNQDKQAEGKDLDEAEDNTGEEDVFKMLLQSLKASKTEISEESLKDAYRTLVSSVTTTPPSKKQRTNSHQSDHSSGVILNLQKHYSSDGSSLGSGASSVPQGTPLDAFNSPKMSKLVSRGSKTVSGDVYTFCGPLNFADSQEMFDLVFGPNPIMLQVTKFTLLNNGSHRSTGPTSISDSASTAQQFHEFVQRCHFDIFVALCESDYVGIVDSHSAQKATQEVCRKLQSLHQKFQAKSGRNQWITLHLADLYNKYLSFVASLSPTASSWSIVLCKCYYDALIPELKEKMEENNFIMPDMTSLGTKDSQIQALRSVRQSAVTAYDNLQSEKKRIMNLVQPQNQNRQQQQSAYYYSTNKSAVDTYQIQQNTSAPYQQYPETSDANYIGNQQNTNPSAPIFQYNPSQSMSQAETTIRNNLPQADQLQQNFHNQNQQQQQRTSIQNLPSRVGSDGKSYPYNPQEPHILSDYPIGFRGCYGCGNPNHWKFRTECPLRNDPTARKRFWRNLWIHRPHTKRRPDTSAPNSPALPPPSTQQSAPIHYHSNQTNPSPPLSSYNGSTQLQPEGILKNGLGRGKHVNTPAWMQSQQDNTFNQYQSSAPPSLPPLPPAPQNNVQQEPPNKVIFTQESANNTHTPLWITTAHLLQHQQGPTTRPMPLDLDNGLPGITMKFGKDRNAPGASFLCHLDTCAGMSTGRLDVHKCIATRFPSIVAEWIEYTDDNPFDPIKLDCAVEDLGTNAEGYGHLTHIVRYYTPYTYEDGSRVILSFGLGKSVSVNAIIDLTDIRKWKGDLLFSSNKFVAFNLRTEWQMVYRSAGSIFAPPDFNPDSDFARPNSDSPSVGFRHTVDNDNVNGATDNLESGKVVDSHEDGTFCRKVDLQHIINRE